MEAALPQRVSSKSAHTTAIKITSWNYRGLSSGVAYAELLADDADVIILSEHWLWLFDTDKFNSIHPQMLGAVVCDSRLTSECNLSKGVEELELDGGKFCKLASSQAFSLIESVLSVLT